jgi:hypothetical protein
VENLTLQIRDINHVIVNNCDVANPGGGQILNNWAT